MAWRLRGCRAFGASHPAAAAAVAAGAADGRRCARRRPQWPAARCPGMGWAGEGMKLDENLGKMVSFGDEDVKQG